MWGTGDLRTPPRSPGEDDDWTPRVPRKRFRNARRHYRRLARWADEYRIDTAGWYDMWHTHPDRRGHGNLGGRHRRRHLAAGFTVFRMLLQQARNSGRPMQVFMILLPADSSADGVYVHTPNPNRENFPFLFPDVEWDVPAPPMLREFLIEPDWQLGRYGTQPVVYYVRPQQD